MSEQQDGLHVSISREELIPYIKEQGKFLDKTLTDAQVKYGSRYNDRNHYEIMYQKFGRPTWKPEKFIDEYIKITNRESLLPAAIRYPVRDIVQAAINHCMFDKQVKAYKEAQTKKQEEAQEKTD
jgi:hypothetical protein